MSDRTLTDADLDAIAERVVDMIAARFPGVDRWQRHRLRERQLSSSERMQRTFDRIMRSAAAGIKP